MSSMDATSTRDSAPTNIKPNIQAWHKQHKLKKLDAARSMLLVNGFLTRLMDREVRRRLKLLEEGKTWAS